MAKGQHVERQTRRRRWEALYDDLPYAATQLDRSVTTPDQIRTVVREWKAKLFTELFSGRSIVSKTLIFAKTDHHADEIVRIVREEFGRGNDFCKRITYGTTSEKADELIKRFRNNYDPRVAVTVDVISTGTDIRPLECLIFLRDVHSRVYFDQMKGRGTRTMQPSDLQLVTEDAPAKTAGVNQARAQQNGYYGPYPLPRRRVPTGGFARELPPPRPYHLPALRARPLAVPAPHRGPDSPYAS